MKHWAVLTILLIISCVDADDNARVNSVRVYYYGFEIERITGIHEEEIQEIGCEYFANEESITDTISPLDVTDVRYDPLDVRARFEFREEIYFVDRDGIVRQGTHYFRLDKENFVRALTLTRDCT